MSLTNFIKNSDVREQFSKTFRAPRFAIDTQIVASPVTKNYQLVGTAFDYLLRFYLQRLNHGTITKEWVAENSAELLCLQAKIDSALCDSRDEAKKILANANRIVGTYIDTGVDDGLYEAAIMLAHLDVVYRAGIVDFTLPNKGDIEDLKKLYSIIPSDLFKAKKISILNPTFGEASQLVGGADADLIIDNTLIDIKTVQKPVLDKDTFYQLMGYYTLSIIDTSHKERNVDNVGVYFSRHAKLYTFSVNDIINKDEFPNFIDWFKQKADAIEKQPTASELSHRIKLR